MNREINANIYIENLKTAYFPAQNYLPNTVSSIRNFVGREVYLKALHKSYQDGARCFVLHGIGGVGKTALALEFVNKISKDFEAKILVRMQGMSKTPYSSRDAMFEIVRQFEPEVSADISDNELKSKFIQLVQNQRTLIVLDGAENKQSVEALIEANACFITTSREVFVLSGGKSIKLQKMLPADARRLLVGIAGRKRLNGQAGRLAELAGYLPMALKPLASILAEDELETATNLVDKYSKKLSKIVTTYKGRKEETRYSRRVLIDEIEKNEFNLNISRYISTSLDEEIIDLKIVNTKLVDLDKDIAKARETHNQFLKELGLLPI